MSLVFYNFNMRYFGVAFCCNRCVRQWVGLFRLENRILPFWEVFFSYFFDNLLLYIFLLFFFGTIIWILDPLDCFSKLLNFLSDFPTVFLFYFLGCFLAFFYWICYFGSPVFILFSFLKNPFLGFFSLFHGNSIFISLRLLMVMFKYSYDSYAGFAAPGFFSSVCFFYYRLSS